MRLAGSVSLATSLLILLSGSTHQTWAAAASGSVRLTQAQFAVTSPALLDLVPRKLGALPALEWTRVSLPHVRRRTVLTQRADFPELKQDSITAWYRIEVPPAAVAQTQALYVPRWYTWGRLHVYADGELIFSSAEQHAAPSLNEMLLVRIAGNRTNGDVRPHEILIRMDSARVIGGVLSSVWIGPMADMQEKFAVRRSLLVGVPQVSTATLLALGVFAVCLWFTRRREVSHLLFFVLAVLYFLRNLSFFSKDWPLSEGWLTWIALYSHGWLIVVTYLFALRSLGLRHPRTEHVLIGAMSALTLLTVPLTSFQRSLSVFGSLLLLVFGAVRAATTVWLSVDVYRKRSLEGVLLVCALWLTIVIGSYDYGILSGQSDAEGILLGSLSFIAVFAAFLFALLRRYAGAISAVEQSNVHLQTTLAERERELAQSYARLREREHAEVLSQERQRLMREMHDGLGSALMSSLVAVERGQMRPADIAQVLRECVDDLKLTIDSLDPVGDDLLVLLATLRYRLEPRLEAAGLQLQWDVHEVPKLAWLNPGAALQILRIVQEVLANVLKHAHARTIRVATQADADQVTVLIADDGVGFDVQQVKAAGRGLENMKRRAAQIDGRIEIESGGGATVVRIVLPVHRRSGHVPT